MKTSVLRTIEQQLPDVFDRYHVDGFSDGVIIVRGNIDEYDNDPLRDDDERTSREELEGAISAPTDPRGVLRDRLQRVHGELDQIRGRDVFPGQPTWPAGGTILPPDWYAFYLPWHHFYPNTWGI